MKDWPWRWIVWKYHGPIDKASIDKLDDIEMEVVEEEEEVELDKSNDCEDVDEEYK